MVDRDPDAWRLVDEGWGRRAAEFATLSEPANAREYVALQHRLGIGDGDRVLDLACGSGLAMELATLRGATVAGIDASDRLVAVAQQRLPEADIRVGDMHALPWEDGSFDVVTSFRGIWGTTPEALAEARRVLTPGGRLGFTVWGHIKKSPGAWALSPFRLANESKVQNQANMVALGRPGVGEELLASYGFEDVCADDSAVRLGVRRPGVLRADARIHRAGVRGDPGGRRGGVPALGHRDGARARPRRAAAACGDRRGRAIWHGRRNSARRPPPWPTGRVPASSERQRTLARRAPTSRRTSRTSAT